MHFGRPSFIILFPQRKTKTKKKFLSYFSLLYTHCISAEGEEAPPPKECPGYDTKQFDDAAPVMLEF